MAVQQLAELLERWRQTGGVVDRGRVIADGMQVLSGLSPEERRSLSRTVAEQGAPQVAERLASASGDRVDPSVLHDAATSLLALEPEQLDRLGRALGDTQERQRLAREAGEHGRDTLEAAVSGDAPLPPPPPAERIVDDLAPAPPVGSAAEVPTTSTTSTAVAELIDLTVDPDTTEAAAAPAGTIATADEFATTPADEVPPTATQAPSEPTDGGDDALLERLVAATSAHERFTVLAPTELEGLGVDAALRVLDAVPEGWQRRRVADRLGTAGALRGVSAQALLRRFPRPSDATFVAGGAMAHGALDTDQLAGLLPDHIVRRLATRTER